ncbi:MAG: hypothetical protein PF447_01605 [Spirochaetaceae bacterium]|nr:hypothetical protein [Spirochaetaceae bacterium]
MKIRKKSFEIKKTYRPMGQWPISFSMGVVTLSSPAEDVKKMIHIADKLMYSVKRTVKTVQPFKNIEMEN